MVLGDIAAGGPFPDLCISRWSFLAGQHLWQYLQFRDWKLPDPPKRFFRKHHRKGAIAMKESIDISTRSSVSETRNT